MNNEEFKERVEIMKEYNEEIDKIKSGYKINIVLTVLVIVPMLIYFWVF